MSQARTRNVLRRPVLRRPVLLAALLLAACTSGGGGGGGFRITSVSIPKNAVWQINRPIRITFSEAVDFSTVNLNTINIRRSGGSPSAGEFFLDGSNVVVFQPRCPTLDDFSDAGLLPGGILYELNVLGDDKQAPITIRSKAGVSLAVGDTRTFSTPNSTLPLELFFDPKVGPPAPVVRTQTGPDATRTDACYLELGGDPDQRVWFRLDGTGQGFLDPFTLVPLNKLSDQASQVALVLYFDQPIDPTSANINAQRLAWQFDAAPAGAGSPDWRPLITDVELEANCTQTGALLRIEPRGVLPPDTSLRVVIAPEFSDIVGQTNLLVQDTFALADTEPGPAAPDPLGDQFLDEFASSANLDTSSGLGAPPAVVEDSTLGAAFSFDGTGGPGGNFDWLIPTGQTLIFSTDTSAITGGPNFSSSNTVTIVGGVVDLRNMRIESGGRLKVIGPNPFTILASGKVEIFGELNINGTDDPGVTSLGTTNIPQPGASGQAGGGKGGTGSPLITSSSPKGGNGFGAFNVPDAGGQGGETGWHDVNSQLDARRGAGGGGGTLGRNQAQTFGAVATFGDWDQSYIGLDGEPGFPNLDPNSKGALNGPAGPIGGTVGPSPFTDTDTTNDFYGTANNDNGTPADPTDDILIIGELKKPWAGGGGGGGGDASYVGVGGTFPATPFNIAGDEKGSGGGGGGGSLQILALGDIVFGPQGVITCRGGTGGGGENTLYLNRVGGGSGAGSGGHVILQTAGVIDLSLALGPSATAGKLAGGIIATGGQAGAGKQDKGGAIATANGKKETPPINDACPPTIAGGSYPTAGDNACVGHIDGTGGDGGPGLIQLHAPGGWAGILSPVGKTLADVCKPMPLYFNSAAGPGAPVTTLLPGFGKESKARSNWIALGQGGFSKATGTYAPVTFDFAGIDPTTGLVLTDGSGSVVPGAEILPVSTLVAAPGVPSILDARRIVVDAGPLLAGPDKYLLDNLQLLDRYLVELENQVATIRFDVVAAEYSPSTQALTLTISDSGPSLVEKHGPGSTVTLREAFFRVASSGQVDSLPVSASVRFSLEATSADAAGDPDPAAVVGPTFDVQDLNNAIGNPDFRFVRFEVTFDIDAQDTGLKPTNPIPSIDFLRIPFRYQ